MSPPAAPGRAARLPYFFYGTLVDRDLLAVVTGEAVAEGRIEPAWVAGYRRTGLVGRKYPILMRRTGACADGILVHGLAKAARARLAAYEGTNYKLVEVAATNGQSRSVRALVFLAAAPVSDFKTNRRPWRLAPWQRRWKGRALRRAARLLDCGTGV